MSNSAYEHSPITPRADTDSTLRGLEALHEHPQAPDLVASVSGWLADRRRKVDAHLDKLDANVANAAAEIDAKDQAAAQARADKLSEALQSFRNKDQNK